MDVVSLALAKNYTNEKLNSLPSNAPTKTVSFDGGIYSVGNDVVNGQVSDVVVKGNTRINILGDAGDFENDTGGFASTVENTHTSIRSNYALFGNKSLMIRADAEGVRYSGKTINLDPNKYYFLSIYGKSDGVAEKRVYIGELSKDILPRNTNVIWERGYTKITGKSQIKVYCYSIRPAGQSVCSCYYDGLSLHEISSDEYNNLTDNELAQKYNFHNGTKSTNSVRIRSVNEDETKESIVNVNLPEPLRSLPNGTKDEVSVVEGKRTQNVKEYVLQASDIDRVGNYAPNYTIDIGLDAFQGIIPQTPAAMGNVSIAGMTEINGSSGAVSWVDGVFGTNSTQLRIGSTTITTLEQAREQFTGLAVTYQLAEPIVTKLPAQPPLQIYENGTVYVEPIGDASESTLPSVEMTIPTGTSNKFGVATHNYGGAAADWVLTNSESKCFLLAVSSAGGSANIIAPNRPGTMYAISNASGHTITIKISGGNGVKVTNAKTVLVIHNGTDYVALTAEL